MITSEHPRIDDLLLWQTGELTDPEAKIIELHLKECSACQNKVADADAMFGRVAKVDAEAERRRKQAGSQQIFKSRAVMGTTAMVVVCALVFTSLTQWTPAARAESLLTKAVQEQARDRNSVRFLKVQSGPFACNVALASDSGQLRYSSTGSPDFCEKVSSNLSSAGRRWNSLLSAESFQQWRHSLTKKQDSIVKTVDSIMVNTLTDEGSLREASLELRSADYQPISAHFEFAGEAPMKIDVDEDHAAEEIATRTASLSQAEQKSTTENFASSSIIDPLDVTEARVRLALHEAQLDRNILLAVERGHNSVLVWGIVPTEADRTALNDAVQTMLHVRVSVLTEAEQQEQRKPLPWESYQGDGVPLAYEQLKNLFPSDEPARQQFQNDLDMLTRRIVGEARTRDALLVLHSRLSSSEEEPSLERAAAELANAMRLDTLSLAARLAPLTGPIAQAGSTLSRGQAMQLYTLVHEMTFMGQEKSNLQLAQAVTRTKRLLARR